LADRVVVTIESRMLSTRLPGKNARPILGRPMLARLIERVRRAREVDVVCLATTTDSSDDPLCEIAREAGAEVHRGSVDDVLGRVLGAARSVNADLIAEITGDCPLTDPAIVDAAIARYRRGDVDYVANILDGLTFPAGLDVQVFPTALLAETAASTSDPGDRIDVTPYIHRNGDRYRLLNLRAPADLDRPAYWLCVDYPEDFEVVTAVYEALYPTTPEFDARAIIRFLDAHPSIATRNTGRPGLFTFPTSGGAARQEPMAV
jgi:spore coat polysaccharide biosynthesis protein SpsF